MYPVLELYYIAILSTATHLKDLGCLTTLLINLLPSRGYEHSRILQLPTPLLHGPVAVYASAVIFARTFSTAPVLANVFAYS